MLWNKQIFVVTLIFSYAISFLPAGSALGAPGNLKVLIVDGQNNHDWRATTPVLQAFLEQTGCFKVDVATTPTESNAPQEAWDKFRPKFSQYDIVLSNYNGQIWPEPVQQSFVEYVAGGGGVVIVHAANNAFAEWTEYNQMIGLGWRGAGFGDRVTFNEDGSLVRTSKGEGPGAGHGAQHDFAVVVRDAKHPVMRDVRGEWLHVKDELYHGQRGPAADMHVLATAFSAPQAGGTGTHEPMVWWVPYGSGKVFTTVMGHGDYSMTCVGFQTIVARGCEWAATGQVTLDLPQNFPTVDAVSINDPRKKNED